eukprot:7938525-Alexandrium_andersonii.AAC.1
MGDVERGAITHEHMIGNTRADRAATEGLDSWPRHAAVLMRHISVRQRQYNALVKDVVLMM